MISDIKANLKLGSPLQEATKEGVRSRIRPCDNDGGYGSYRSVARGYESRYRFGITASTGDCHYRRIDRATFFALFIFPLIVEVVYERMLYDKNGKLLQRRI